MNPPFNFAATATIYAGFLGALGGVCITILTLVLALRPKDAKRKNFHPLLVATLLVAAIACFVGAHLMADVVGIEHYAQILRLFRIGGINIYIAVSLFAFSLMLLPMVYSKDIPKELKLIGMLSFMVVEVGALYWLYSAITSPYINPSNLISGHIIYSVAAIVGVANAIWNYFILDKDADNFPPMPFYTCLAAVLLSLGFYNFTRDMIEPAIWIRNADKLIYCFASFLPISALIGVGFKAYSD